MGNQKGSVKDRLRARSLFLKYKATKKKKEKELLKLKKQEQKMRIKAEQLRLYGKYYSKPKVFMLTILGLFFGLLTPKKSKNKIDAKIDIIEKEQKQIFLRLEQDKDVNEIYNSIDNTYQKLEDLKKTYKKRILIDSFNPLQKNKILNKIDQKQKELIVINEICHNKAKQDNKINEIPIKKELEINTNKKPSFEEKVTNNKVTETVVINSPMKKEEELKKDYDKPSVNINNKVESNEVKKESPLLLNIKKMNNDIKDYSKEFIYLKEKVTEEETYNTLFEYEFKLKQLLNRYKKMLEEYNLLKENYDLEPLEEVLDIDVFDKVELRKNEKPILNKISECQNLLKEIENKKQILSSKPISPSTKKEPLKAGVENKLEKEKDKKPKALEEEKKELKEQFDDIYLANKMIINNIVEEKKIIEKLKRKISNQTPLTKKRTVFMYAKRFTSSILNFGFSLLPFKYFQNKRLGFLVSSIMLNNSLRTTRKILTINNYQDNYILYDSIINEIKSNEDYISKTYDVCLNSLSQIQSIKEYLNINYSVSMEYDKELLDFNRQLDSLTATLEQQINSLEVINNNYKDLHQKVKVLDGYNGKY